VPYSGGSCLDGVFWVSPAVQQIITELNGAVSEEDKRVSITKIVTKLRKSQWPLEFTGL